MPDEKQKKEEETGAARAVNLPVFYATEITVVPSAVDVRLLLSSHRPHVLSEKRSGTGEVESMQMGYRPNFIAEIILPEMLVTKLVGQLNKAIEEVKNLATAKQKS